MIILELGSVFCITMFYIVYEIQYFCKILRMRKKRRVRLILQKEKNTRSQA